VSSERRFPGAISTKSEDLVPVPARSEAETPAGLLLDLLEGGPENLADVPATHADEVVVVGPFEVDFEAGDSVSAYDRGDQPAFLEHLERTEDRRSSQAVPAKGLVDLFLRQVALRLEKEVKNEPSLPGQAQAVPGQVFVKDAHYPSRKLGPRDFLALVDDEFPHVREDNASAKTRQACILLKAGILL